MAQSDVIIQYLVNTYGGWIGLCSVLRPLQHSIGYMGDGFYRSKDPTNSIKVLKEKAVKENNPKNRKKTKITHMHRHIKQQTTITHKIQRTTITQQVPQSTIIWGDQGTAPTEGRVAMPERQWGCHCGTPNTYGGMSLCPPIHSPIHLSVQISFDAILQLRSYQLT